MCESFIFFWFFLISYAQPYLSETLALNPENPEIPNPKPRKPHQKPLPLPNRWSLVSERLGSDTPIRVCAGDEPIRVCARSTIRLAHGHVMRWLAG